MSQFFIGVLTALIGTVGFSLLFSVDLKHLPPAALGGALSWAIYLIIFEFLPSVFAATLCAAFAATIYAEICAHICRTPATVFILPAMIPLVPGGSLYYTMSKLIVGDYSASAAYAFQTAEVVLGLSGGVVAASLIVYAVRNTLSTGKRKNDCK